MTTETKPAIAPRIVSGEPVCSGDECPFFRITTAVWAECFAEMAFGEYVMERDTCIPGLRAQRDEARRELCAEYAEHLGLAKEACERQFAASRGWAYLYEKEGKK